MVDEKKPGFDPNHESDTDRRFVKTVNYRLCQRHGRNIPVGEQCPDCAEEERRRTHTGAP